MGSDGTGHSPNADVAVQVYIRERPFLPRDKSRKDTRSLIQAAGGTVRCATPKKSEEYTEFHCSHCFTSTDAAQPSFATQEQVWVRVVWAGCSRIGSVRECRMGRASETQCHAGSQYIYIFLPVPPPPPPATFRADLLCAAVQQGETMN